MTCIPHSWTAESPCPHCRVEEEESGLKLDLAALHCIPAAYKLTLLDIYGKPGEQDKLMHDAIAAHAYKLARALVNESKWWPGQQSLGALEAAQAAATKVIAAAEVVANELRLWRNHDRCAADRLAAFDAALNEYRNVR
jgi:hypothetical protein